MRQPWKQNRRLTSVVESATQIVFMNWKATVQWHMLSLLWWEVCVTAVVWSTKSCLTLKKLPWWTSLLCCLSCLSFFSLTFATLPSPSSPLGLVTSCRHSPHWLPVHLQLVPGGRPLLHCHQLCGHTWGGTVREGWSAVRIRTSDTITVVVIINNIIKVNNINNMDLYSSFQNT